METTSVKHYETVYITDPSLSESENKQIHEKIDQIIERFEGKMKVRDEWGLKALAFPINNESNGRYFVVNYQGKKGIVEEIERSFKLSEKVLRFLTVRVEEDYDYNKIKKNFHPSEDDTQKKINKDPRKKP